MVKIAIAGPGQVAREIIDGLLATGRHEIVLLSRRDATPELAIAGTTWTKVDFEDKASLVRALGGVHTVLSFIVVHLDPENAAQKALIDASIEAGVKRIAPSEWAVANFNHLDWYGNKLGIREYLEEKNKNGKVIEYTLFQPGWFLNYLAGTRKTAKHVGPAAVTLINHENRSARIAGDLANRTTYTAVSDFVNIVAKAIEYEGEWPRVGGINGQTLSLAEELAIGEKVRGGPYEVENLEVDDLKAGIVKTKSLPVFDHPSMAKEDAVEFSKRLLRGIILNAAEGAATVSDEWNQIFPDYKFVTAEEFLTGVFGKA